MSTVGQKERATQNRVVKLFRYALEYTYLGNWEKRPGNSAVEVDLFGQTNSEVIGGRQVSGHGGGADFARGARRSPGGRALVTLLSTGGGGVSRIVAALPRAAPVALTRADADWVVTEHGVAELRHADLDTRAERLIAIAAPEHRDRLAAEWAAIRRAM